MMSGWELLCESATWYNHKGVFMREAKKAWELVNLQRDAYDDFRTDFGVDGK